MRKSINFTATKGRDSGKTFLIEEMSADATEWWAIRCFLAVGNSGLNVPDDMASQGVAGLLEYGIRSLFKIKPEEAKPLLDEMMNCVKIIPSAGVVRGLVSTDIEEVSTRFEIRKQVIDLHTGFFTDDDQLTLGQESQVATNSSATRIPRKR